MSNISITDLRKSYGQVEVIHGVSLDIEPGEFVVFVGPSGCGKSTLLRMIAGLEDITDGDLEIGGTLMNDVEPAQRGIAMVFQSYALYPHMTVADNMSFGLRMAHAPKDEIDRKVKDAARILQLEPLLDRKPAALSGGQRQRVAIGRAIVRDPDVFLFDEPLSNLDAELRVEMRVQIAKLHRTLSNTMIYVTHDQTEAMTLADRIVVLRAGHIEQVGTPIELYEDPDNAFVAGFIGSPRMNFLNARANGPKSVEVAGRTIPLPNLTADLRDGTALQLGIRPEHLDATDGVRLMMDVDVAEDLGATTFVHGTVGGETLVAERRAHVGNAVRELEICFAPDKVRLFDPDGARVR
ncbi:sn-glycerol-3-phosphate ABC transporter ATP-binding protein UgpC [Salipiger sp. IMCC34102]|uniref:ABC transporter ATP-binding protein n=1 Tax=Salipiger sp. IMCC34102 TaxID=2510647 RepID=UPI00101CC700|nr:sn-glycerol-3-phosphate ABC transporter ATP-binding protein UgpC [Salipiger sp. IMCC34102]RYH04274.1 sn-glycerol-3-phosphate ABC transporter ATP-binding protein UgpC [Salipiger sp. IMCC34102]